MTKVTIFALFCRINWRKLNAYYNNNGHESCSGKKVRKVIILPNLTKKGFSKIWKIWDSVYSYLMVNDFGQIGAWLAVLVLHEYGGDPKC